MATKKVGDLIREARTAAGLTQEKLAAKIAGLSAGDISKAERGEAELTQAQLKAIAKATGVTQASLLNAAKGSSAKTAAAKSATAKSTGTRSTAAKTTTARPAASKATSSASTASMRVTSAEKKLVELYREASADQKKAALYILKGESASLIDDIVRNHQNGTDSDVVGGLLQDMLGSLLGKK